jgi:hypothetical protein
MTELALWLVVVGLCDLVRASRDVTSVGRRALISALGVVLLLLAALVLDVSAARTALLLAGWTGCFLLWVLGSAQALTRGTTVARVMAFTGIGLGTLFGVLAADLAGPVSASLPGPLGRYGADRVALVVGVLVVQLATGNVVVRLLLDTVGVPAASNEKTLKGGRVLGPMERLFIVGLGLGGHATTASIVVAAKGLLRFPELQREVPGPSDVTEYFLIGSFASWLLALAGVAVVALA